MPIYEYGCQKCGKEFEELVLDGQPPICPYCGSNETEKLISISARLGRSDAEAGASAGGRCAGCTGGSCSGCRC